VITTKTNKPALDIRSGLSYEFKLIRTMYPIIIIENNPKSAHIPKCSRIPYNETFDIALDKVVKKPIKKKPQSDKLTT